jgi:hypothetical protein
MKFDLNYKNTMIDDLKNGENIEIMIDILNIFSNTHSSNVCDKCSITNINIQNFKQKYKENNKYFYMADTGVCFNCGIKEDVFCADFIFLLEKYNLTIEEYWNKRYPKIVRNGAEIIEILKNKDKRNFIR